MWVFDGEEWKSDETERSSHPAPVTPSYPGEFVPEVQIIQIEPIVYRSPSPSVSNDKHRPTTAIDRSH